jgi:transposase-like protein
MREKMELSQITCESCPKCQSTNIQYTENEKPAWKCYNCRQTFQIPLVTKLCDLGK